MSRNILIVILFLTVPQVTRAATTDSTWVLTKSTLTYRVSHPLHEVQGTSHEARGKGQCQNGQCDFLIAVPVKSFTSGDTNRDLHMLQTVRGAQFPMVVVRTEMPQSEIKAGHVEANLEIQFAGHTAQLKNVPFQLAEHGNQIQLTGTIPATLTDFKIPAPELLFMPIKNAIPVSAQMTWQQQ